jgi:acetyl-CoA carboxylase carboxyl transferase subunit beta
LVQLWFKKSPFSKVKESRQRTPKGLWVKCDNCGEMVYKEEVERNLKVCPKCNYHFRISARERIELLVDKGTFKERDRSLISRDPLRFRDSKKYVDRLKEAQRKTGMKDAVVCGETCIGGFPVELVVFEFGFLGGSMGSVVGEKITRAAERARERDVPLIIVSSSGGARMQESILSLMQMGKTCAVLTSLSEAGVPFISVLTDPTTGGVSASFALLGDVVISEPRALIGFAGPRVIEQTIRQQLPSGFQRAEFLVDHGFVDMVVDRKILKSTLERIVSLFENRRRP